MQDIYTYLKRTGRDIAAQAGNGNQKAADIMKYYSMHYKCPGDPMAQTLLTETVTEYIAEQKEKNGAWPAEAPLSLRK